MILNDEQLLIRNTAKEFSKNYLEPNATKWASDSTFPHDALKKLAELGFMGMLIPEEYQGTNIGYLAYSVVIEEIAKGDASTSTIVSVHNSLVASLILNFGTEQQRKKFLPKLASCELLGCFCLTEPNAGSDASNIQTKANLKNNKYIINGTKQFITSGKNADLAIVFAKTNPELGKKGISAFLVPTNTKGYNAAKIEKKMGQEAAETVQIIFDNLEIPEENLLGKPGDGYKIALSNLELGRIAIAAQAIGIANSALEKSIQFANEREAFGTKIINHQAISFKLADMATKLEVAKNMVYATAQKIDKKIPSLKHAAMTKLFATEISEEICKQAIQIHGGYGYLSDYIVERLYRDVRVCTLYEGTSDIQKIIISREFNHSLSDR